MEKFALKPGLEHWEIRRMQPLRAASLCDTDLQLPGCQINYISDNCTWFYVSVTFSQFCHLRLQYLSHIDGNYHLNSRPPAREHDLSTPLQINHHTQQSCHSQLSHRIWSLEGPLEVTHSTLLLRASLIRLEYSGTCLGISKDGNSTTFLGNLF